MVELVAEYIKADELCKQISHSNKGTVTTTIQVKLVYSAQEGKLISRIKDVIFG